MSQSRHGAPQGRKPLAWGTARRPALSGEVLSGGCWGSLPRALQTGCPACRHGQSGTHAVETARPGTSRDNRNSCTKTTVPAPGDSERGLLFLEK